MASSMENCSRSKSAPLGRGDYDRFAVLSNDGTQFIRVDVGDQEAVVQRSYVRKSKNRYTINQIRTYEACVWDDIPEPVQEVILAMNAALPLEIIEG